MTTSYLQSAERQFRFYKRLAEQAMEQVSEEQLFILLSEESNSIALIVQHLKGNMISRWTNFLTEDGEKSWRKRDSEFEQSIQSREALMQVWEEGWQCLFHALESIGDQDLDRIVYIRNEGHSILDAINRQLAHYPYHVGQIVFIAKMFRNQDWKSLSIPRNKSAAYNDTKFSLEPGVRHFTEEFLQDKSKKDPLES